MFWYRIHSVRLTTALAAVFGLLAWWGGRELQGGAGSGWGRNGLLLAAAHSRGDALGSVAAPQIASGGDAPERDKMLGVGGYSVGVHPVVLGVVAALAALGSGVLVSGVWSSTVGALAFAAARMAKGEPGVSFGSAVRFREVQRLSQAMQRLVEARDSQSRSLRGTLRHFHGTFENKAVGIFHLATSGSFQRVNGRFCQISGLGRENLLETNLEGLLHPMDRNRFSVRMRLLLEGRGEHFSMETRCMRPAGGYVWVRLTVTLLRGEDGGAEYAIGFVEDVSARRNAEENLIRSEASLRSLMDCNRDSCVAVLDLGGDILFVNPIGLEVLGATSAELGVGKPWAELWEEGEVDSVEAAMEEARMGGVGRYRGQRGGAGAGGGDLTAKWWEVTVTAVPGLEGRPERLLAVARDVTVQHLAADALQSAKESAEAASRAKDDFLSALSHELRTPLNPVLLLAGEYARSAELPARIREDFALIHRNIRMEARLIDDLLDLTKIQRAGLSMSTRLLDLGGVLTQVCEMVRGEAAEKQVSLQWQRPSGRMDVRGDATRLNQIFSNLILNAIKFTGAGGVVRLKASKRGGVIRVSVSDDGIGISQAELSTIFEPFAQGNHAKESHRFGGLGLGLAISRMLVERHRGRIWAESMGCGFGADFHVELPADVEAGQEPAMVPAVCEPSKKEVRSRKILLVEDHEATRVTLARMLTRRGHTVRQASNLKCAFQCAREETFDVLISDIGLPDGNGNELIEQMGERFLEGGIALSGFGMEAEVARSLQAGFRKHLTKPVEVEMIEETLNGLEPTAVQSLLAI